MSEDRILSANITDSENCYDVQLRPQSFEEYVGQAKIVKNVKIMAESAMIRKQAMDHLLLSGPPGLGKTTLANIIAKEVGANLHVISGPAIEKKGDIAAILTNLNPRDVLFIEEILYSAMEDFKLDILIGQGAAARTMQIDLPPFTLIGATTRSGLLSNPLRDRFIANLHFDFYDVEDLEKIIYRNAQKLILNCSSSGQKIIAKCSRGTPRIANRILRRLRDMVLVEKISSADDETVRKSLDLMDIDELGLDRMDRKILQVIEEYYGGGPVGIDALCATLSEERSTLEDVYEPYLLKEGFLLRTSRGRMTSDKTKEHLKVDLSHRLI